MKWLIETKNQGRISVDLAKCCACRSCELACSFHHERKFNPSRSSIHVHREDGKGTLEISLTSTCDGCPEDQPPWCVRFCSSGCLHFEEGYPP